jgi:hypothetical protein
VSTQPRPHRTNRFESGTKSPGPPFFLRTAAKKGFGDGQNSDPAKRSNQAKGGNPQRAAAKACARPKIGGRTAARYWSARVTKESDALDLEGGVFSLKDPKRIAASLKRSAEKSRRRKAEPYRSALSMLVFYINRAGKKLPASRRRTLERAKSELRRQFGRD